MFYILLQLDLYGNYFRQIVTQVCVNGNYNTIPTPPTNFATDSGSVTCAEAEFALAFDTACTNAIQNGDKNTYCSGTCRQLGDTIANSCGTSV